MYDLRAGSACHRHGFWHRYQPLSILLLVAAAILTGEGIFPTRAAGATIAAPYDSSYTLTNLGSIGGVPGPYGGLVIKDGDPSKLLIGGNANNGAGAIYQVTVTRDAFNHITGFSGPATLFATAPNIDGGLAYGPGGVLFYTAYPINDIGQIEPGSSSPDRIVSLPAASDSVGALAFVPPGFSGAGQFKIVSYNNYDFFTASLTPDGNGTYNIGPLTFNAHLQGGPEGIAYVPLGSPQFANPSMLLAEYQAGKVATYEVDSNGNPIAASRKDFITGLSGAEGAAIDPLTGDFLFSTFGSGNEVFVVKGFVAPAAVPEPATLVLAGLGVFGLAGYSLRYRKRVASIKQS